MSDKFCTACGWDSFTWGAHDHLIACKKCGCQQTREEAEARYEQTWLQNMERAA